MSSKNFYGLTGDVTIDGGILNVGNAQLYANTETSNVGIGTTNPEFTLDVHGDANVGVLYSTFLHGDGSNIENIVSSQWEGLPGDPIYYTSNVGIANTVPVTVTLQIGSNVAIDDTGANVIEVYGNVNASYFIGDGSQLTGIAATLDDIVDQGNTVSNTIILESGADPVSNIGLVTKEGVCISVSNTNATGEFQFGVGSNLFVNVYSSNVLTVGGNVFAEKMTLGTVTIKPAYNLEQVTGQGNATSNTIQFTNATTGLVTTSNINVGGRLVFGANVFVDSLRTADLAANLVTYDATTGELLDSAGLISNKLAVVSEQPPTAIEASSEEGTVGNLFDKDIGTKWVSTATYSTTNDGTLGDYIGSADLTSTGPLGEWVKITLPYATILRHIKCESTNSSVEDLTIVGLGADGVTWTTLKSVTGLTGNTHAIVVDAIAEYKTYGFIIQVTNSTSGRSAVEIGELRLFTESFSIDGGYTTITQLRLGSTLEVSGNVEVGTANLFVDTVTGNVGIGKTNPGATLDIAGNMRLGDGLGNVVDFSIETTPTIGDPIWQAALLHPSPAVGDNFGHSVSISADGLYALVGVRSDDVTNAGSAQVYIRVGTSWVWQAQLLHPNPAANDFFGGSVSISADGLYALVGAYGDDTVAEGNNVGSAHVYVRTGTSWSHQKELFHPNLAANDFFGRSVSISGDGLYALIGVAYDDTGASGAGSAQVYVRTGTSWSHQAQLLHPNPAANDYFGYSVSISGDGLYALVGVAYDDTGATDAGSAQVYVRTGTSWAWQAELVHPTPAVNDYFGGSVSISGDGLYALVGAYADDGVAEGYNAGSAQVYVRTGTSWAWQAELLHPSPAVSDYFGGSVSISGDGLYALVGAFGDDTVAEGNNVGSAQVFKRTLTSWAWQAELVHPTRAANDYFGYSVSISADGLYALVGVAYDDTGGSGAGSAQVYVRTGTSWAWQAELVHPTPAANDEFGYSVSISADGLYALIGAYRDDTGGSNAGSAQVYVRTGTSWAWQTELVHPTPAAGDFFGYSVSISGDGVYALVGVHLDDTGATNTGSAQVYVGGPEMETELIVSTPIKADGTLLSFTGQHICFPEGRMSQGLVVSANQNKYMSLNGPVTMGLGAIKSSESLPVVSLSNVANDRSVFGVVDRFEGGGTERTQTIGIGKVSSAKEVGDNRVIVNSIGEGALWVANTNGNLVSGDYLTTSSLPGYAQKQDSDSLKNSTVAKITMACDFSPEDIPVQIIKKKENGDNDLDSYGRFQWVDTEKTQKVYQVRYLTSDGDRTDQSNAVHIAAYVGCTYHCG